MHNKLVDISIVVPVYNSASTIAELVRKVTQAMLGTQLAYELILTDDCSTDDSWQTILGVCEFDQRIVGLRLGKNQGQWCATLAGMSLANGKYIVTMDDDLEYDPVDILGLYNYITTNNYMAVFGIAADKYALQGKSHVVSTVRNKLLNILWNKPVTDSFRIVRRSLVFDGIKFLPTEPLDVFITHTIEQQKCGYSGVRFNKRYYGVSNYSFIQKGRLFFIYSAYYAAHMAWRIFFLAVLFFIFAGVGWLLFSHHLFMQGPQILIFSGMGFTGALLLFYAIALLNPAKQVDRFSITDAVNKLGLPFL